MTVAMPLVEAAEIVTPEEFLRMRDTGGVELIDGQPVEKNVSRESSYIAIETAAELRAAARPLGHQVYGSDLGYQCFPDDPGRVRKPDVSVVRGERVAELGGDVGFMPFPPDLAVEVVSPNDVLYDVSAKVEEYLSADFPLVWVLNPPDRTAVVHAAGRKPVLLSADDRIDAGDLLPGWGVQVAELFGG